MYEYRLNAYNKLSTDDSSCSSSTDSDVPLQVVTKKPRSKKRKAKAKTKTVAPTTPLCHNQTAMDVSNNQPTVLRKPKVTIIGDSIIRGSGSYISSRVQNYDTCVLSTSGYKISRSNAASQITNIAKDHLKNDILVLSIGTNDVESHSNTELSNMFRSLIRKVQCAAPDCHVIITAIPSRIAPGTDSLNAKIYNINKSLRALCEQGKNYYFIDCNPEITLQNYKYDGLHLSHNGVIHFSTVLSDFINTNFQVKEALRTA